MARRKRKGRTVRVKFPKGTVAILEGISNGKPELAVQRLVEHALKGKTIEELTEIVTRKRKDEAEVVEEQEVQEGQGEQEGGQEQGGEE